MKEFYEGLSNKVRTWGLPALVSTLIYLTFTSCGPKSLREIEGKLSDVESEILTRGANQRNTNAEWNIYLRRLWKWDDDEIEIMLEWARDRANTNKDKRNELLEKGNDLLDKRNEAIAKQKRNNHSRFDEDECSNSDSALVESIMERNKTN